MATKFIAIFLIVLLFSSCNSTDYQQIEGYVEGENIYLASPYFGTLEKLSVHRGQHVEKGTLLFKLDPNPQYINILQVQGELQQAKNILIDLQKPKRAPEITAIQAQIEQTKSQIELAKIRVSRFQKLYEKNASDKDTLDAAIANLQLQENLKMQYEANLELAKLGSRDEQIKAQKNLIESLTAKLNEAKWELSQKTIYAPASGVIFDTYFREGEFVSPQQPVVSLLTPENIQIEFFVTAISLSKVQIGKKITFNCEGCEKNNYAEVSYISPDAEFLPPLIYSRDNNSKLVFRIKAHISNPSLFKPGQPVVVNL